MSEPDDQPGPRLVPVPDVVIEDASDRDESLESSAHEEPPRTSRGMRLLRLVVTIALLAAAGYGIIESRRAAELEAEVTQLTADLGAARAETQAVRNHLDTVRDGVSEARASLEALEALAGRDPLAPREP